MFYLMLQTAAASLPFQTDSTGTLRQLKQTKSLCPDPPWLVSVIFFSVCLLESRAYDVHVYVLVIYADKRRHLFTFFAECCEMYNRPRKSGKDRHQRCPNCSPPCALTVDVLYALPYLSGLISYKKAIQKQINKQK